MTSQMQLPVGDEKSFVVGEIKNILSPLSDAEKLQVFRDLVTEDICKTISKFPVETQKQMVTVITHKFLSRWK